LRFDYDPTTTYRARLLPFDAIRRMQNMNMSVSRRSRIVVESQLPHCHFVCHRAHGAKRIMEYNPSDLGGWADPRRNQYSVVAIESASHFLCQCDRFITLRKSIRGKSYLRPASAYATVRDLVRFVKVSQIHPEVIIAPGRNRETDGPNQRPKPTGQLYLPCPILELEFGRSAIRRLPPQH